MVNLGYHFTKRHLQQITFVLKLCRPHVIIINNSQHSHIQQSHIFNEF